MGIVLTYAAALNRSMLMLADHPLAIFMGQGVGNPGTTMSPTFAGIDAGKLLEMPVAEDMQMGMAIGMAIDGLLPICVFPRWNFLLCAANQLVNHLDRLPLYSAGGYRPKVIIRTAVPSTKPFNPGPQHDDDFTGAFERMLRTVDIITLRDEAEVMRGYIRALASDRSTLLVEYTDYYKDERGNA